MTYLSNEDLLALDVALVNGLDVHATVEALVAKHRAAELREAAKEIYNGAGDPEQAFYNYRLNPWLIARADRIDLKDGAR